MSRLHTASFHSYRGGRGRTTTIVSLANLLARLGKRVLILDLDITAPWIQTQYAPVQGHKRGVGDLLQVIGRFPRGTIGKLDLDDYRFASPPGFDDVPGSVEIISPGDPDTESYWHWVAAEIPTLMGLRQEPTMMELWRDLRRVIAASDPSLDVLLIDAPAGLHHASVLAGAGLSDAAAFFATADKDSLAITAKLIARLRGMRSEILEQRYGALRIVGVRARYPTFLDVEQGRLQEGENAFLEGLGGLNAVESVVTVPGDPRLEHVSGLPIDLDTINILRTPVVESYARLLCQLFPAFWRDTDELWSKLPNSVSGVEPRFFWLEDQGVLTNPLDDSPNVAFRVATFCGLIDDVHAEYLERGAGRVRRARPRRSVPETLREAGRLSGERFGKDLVVQWTTDGSEVDLLDKWCDFDSRVGFGRMRAHVIERSGPRVTAGEIEVESNFLAVSRSAQERDLCPILTGYVAGVLEVLFGRHFLVEHPPESCMRLSKGRSSCTFRFAEQ